MRVAYLVSRFPAISETFVVREVDAVHGCDGIEVEVYSLFPHAAGPVHPLAARWTPRRARPLRSLRAVAFFAVRRPVGLARILARVATGHRRAPRRLVRALVTVVAAAGHARDMRTDGVRHVHAHFASYPALAAWVIQRLTGIGYSFTAHAHDIYVDQSMLVDKIREARAVVTISDFNREFLARFGAGTATPVEVIRCGVDLARFPYRERELPEDGPVRALCVATLQEKKGHRLLLQALADAGESLARVELDLVGGGELRAELEQLTVALGLAERVRFHGPQTEPEVAELLDRADLLVLASTVARDGQMEGLPVVLVEALASGVAVVTTRLSGTPELIREGETGTLAEPGDPASLRAALERALAELADPAVARARGRAGRAAVEARHDLRASGSRMAGLLRSLGTESPVAAERVGPARRIVDLLDRPASRFVVSRLMRHRIRQVHGESVAVRYSDGSWVVDWPGVSVPMRELRSSPSPREEEDSARDVFFQEYTPVQGDVIVDIGAGVGWELNLFSRLVGPSGHVFAVEADPETHAWLERRRDLNRLENVTTVQVAVTDRAGEVTIGSDGFHESHRIVLEGPGHRVRATTLDELVAAYGIDRIDFLKVNIEGAERAALTGAETTMAITRNVAVSCHDFLADRGGDDSTRTESFVRGFLAEHGFVVVGRRADDHRDYARGYVYGKAVTTEPS